MTAICLLALVPAAAADRDGPSVKIGGQYRVMVNSSNFDFHQGGFAANEENRTFWNQRFRTWLDVRADARTTAHLQLEIGHLTWGDGEFPKTHGGDRIGIETRRAFVTYELHDARFDAGILGWTDGFGGVLASADWDFDVGGIQVTLETPAGRYRAGFLKLLDTDPRRTDDNLYFLDGAWPIGAAGELGAHAYLKDVNIGGEVRSFWVGGHVRRAVGSASLFGFAILNRNELVRADEGFTHGAFKAEAVGRTAGGLELAAQVLLSTGDSDSTAAQVRGFQTVAQSVGDGFGAQSYWSYLGIMSPRGSSDVNDLGVGIQNQGAGLTAVQARAVLPVTGWTSLYAAVGYHLATDPPPGRSSAMGTELLVEERLELSDRLALEIGGAVAFLGDYFERPATPDPPRLYEVFSRLQLEF